MISMEDLKRDRVGAFHTPSKGTLFKAWAPNAERLQLHLTYRENSQAEIFEMEKGDRGYFSVLVPKSQPGDRYWFSVDEGEMLADPASRFQPEGVHGPSEVVSSDFAWTDKDWKGLNGDDIVFYELHIGTFSTEGTFEGAIAHLPKLRELGVNAIEVMPISQFSGARNWGYDGVFPFAAQSTYGGPEGFKKFVNACHAQGIGVVLDVVYNHLGPEGNVLPRFGPYFQDKYRTPWGEALNYDGTYSDEVKKYFAQNMVQWLGEFHLDGLRLDAVHAILDESQHRFLTYLGEFKRELEKSEKRSLFLIAESDLNDPKMLEPVEKNGFELDMQWNDDFHHSLRTLLTGEKEGYYHDYGSLRQLADAFAYGTVYRDTYSHFRKASRGREFKGIDKRRLVVYSQNHDQIGNRMKGDRLIELAGLRKQSLAAACVFLSPFTPFLFMGEEWAERNPFLYFVDHEDKELLEAVRKGRREEFRDFTWNEEPPDPASEETFVRSRIAHENFTNREESRRQFEYYQSLIRFSKQLRKEKTFDRGTDGVICAEKEKVIQLSGKDFYAVFCFSSEGVNWDLQSAPGTAEMGRFEVLIDSVNPGKVGGQVERRLQLEPWSALLVRRSPN